MNARHVVTALLFTVLVVKCVSCTQREKASSLLLDSAPATSVAASAAETNSAPPRELPPPVEPRPVRVVPPSTWVWQSHRGDHFSILFPGEPKLRVLPAEDDRSSYTEASFDMPGGQVSFAAGYTDYTAEDVEKPEAFLDLRANAPRRGRTDVLHKRSVTLPGGEPGRVLILRREISGPPLRVYSRLYLVGRRLYSLIVSTLDDGGVGEDVVKRFMESFKLL